MRRVHVRGVMHRKVKVSAKHQNRILIVSGNAELRNALAEQVRAWSFRAVVANDGRDAYEYIHGGQADAVVTEMELGRLDGVSLLERTRGEESLIPFVFLVSATDTEKLKRAAKFRIAAFLEKPHQKEKLRETLIEAIALTASIKRLNHQLRELCKFAHLSPVRARELLQLQRRAMSPLAAIRFPARRSILD